MNRGTVRPARPLLIFDFDDTLVVTAPLYSTVRREVTELVSSQRDGQGASLDASLFGQLWMERDRALVDVMRFSRQQFPTAAKQAYEELARRSGIVPDAAVSQQVYDLAATVFTRPSGEIPAAAPALKRLRKTHRLVLLTKGEDDIQQARIDLSGLRGFFAPEDIIVVGKKKPETFASIAAARGYAPKDAISIGNSPAADIVPALQAGLAAVWIPADTFVENDDKPTFGIWSKISSIAELPAALIRLESKMRRGVPQAGGPELAA